MITVQRVAKAAGKHLTKLGLDLRKALGASANRGCPACGMTVVGFCGAGHIVDRAAHADLLRGTGVHHVAIIASDYARSRRFYTEVLGLPVVHEHYRAERQSYKLDLQLPDGTQVELFSFPNPPRRPSTPEAQGLRHLAFAVDDIAMKLFDRFNRIETNF